MTATALGGANPAGAQRAQPHRSTSPGPTPSRQTQRRILMDASVSANAARAPALDEDQHFPQAPRLLSLAGRASASDAPDTRAKLRGRPPVLVTVASSATHVQAAGGPPPGRTCAQPLACGVMITPRSP